MNIQVPTLLPFLKYDPSEVPALVAGFALGPLAGLAVVLLKNLIFLGTHFQPQEFFGIPFNTIAGFTFVGTSSSLYRMKKTKRMGKASLFLGALAMTLVMIPTQMVLYPIFQAWFLPQQQAMQQDALVNFILKVVVPFNILKGSLTSVITYFTYKRFSRILKSESLWDADAGASPLGAPVR